MGATDRVGSVPAGWSFYVWDGQGTASLIEGTTSSGRRAVHVSSTEPGKLALFQSVNLPACSYRLTAMVAGHALIANRYGQATLLHVALDDRTTDSQVLLSGDSGWRRMTYRFRVPNAQRVTIYFFNHGTGSLFVDNVSLQADPECNSQPASFSLGVIPESPLNYAPPVKSSDRLLEGYCEDEAFRQRPVCARLAAAGPTVKLSQREPRVIANFSDIIPFAASALRPDRKGWALRKRLRENQEAAAQLSGGGVMVAERSNGLAGDWSGFDWLEIEVENSSAAPLTLNVEIRDNKSRDYWSRVNWDAVVPPGRSSAFVPMQAFVGEKSVIKDRRRLDLANVTRLVLASEAGQPDVDILRLQLVADHAFKTDFPRLLKLDFGSPASPVASGFTGFTPDMGYRREIGYGLSADAKIGRVEDRRHPDNLLRDWISFLSGGINIDLPNGQYVVWMMLEDAGYWEHFPSFRTRQVFAQGQPVLNEVRDYPAFAARYFRNASHEDLPGDDVWARYVKGRYEPLVFETEVTTGQLALRFNANYDPLALPISALIIYPKSDAARGEAFLSELWSRLKRDFERENRQVSPPVARGDASNGNALDGRLMVFERPIEEDVDTNFVPKNADLRDAFRLSVARGERIILPLSLLAKEDITLRVTLDLDRIAHDAYTVRNKLARYNRDGTAFWAVPRILDPLNPSVDASVKLVASHARSIWFDLAIPAELPPGRYNGQIRIATSGPTTHTIPIEVDVAPWRLPRADIPIGYLGLTTTYPRSNYLEVGLRRDVEFKDILALLADHGFTAISGGLGGPMLNGLIGNRPKLEFASFDRTMKAVAASGQWTELNTYLGLELAGLALDVRPTVDTSGKPPLRDLLEDIFASLDDRSRTNHWPSLIHAIGDEPSGSDLERVSSLGRLIKSLKSPARTAVFTSVNDPARDPAAGLAGVIDRLYLNSHSETAIRHIRAAGSECSLYNQKGRLRRGLYLLRMSEIGCAGHMQFALSSPHGDPWYDLDGREGDLSAVTQHPDGQLRKSVDFFRYRNALTDYRYAQALREAANVAKPSQGAEELQTMLTDILPRLDATAARPWSTDDFARFRATISDALSRTAAR